MSWLRPSNIDAAMFSSTFAPTQRVLVT